MRRAEKYRRWRRAAATPDLLRALLVRHHGSVLYVAREYGVSRQAVWMRAERFGLIAQVRELCERHMARPRSVPIKPTRPPYIKPSALADFVADGQDESIALRLLIEAYHGEPAELARGVGVHRTTVWRWMRRHGLVGYMQATQRRARSTYDFGVA